MAYVSYERQQQLIRKRRRRNWSKRCRHCGERWKKAKTNYLLEDYGVCLGCKKYLDGICKRGAKWLLEREATLEFWLGRIMTVAPGKKRKGLRAIKGGRS